MTKAMQIRSIIANCGYWFNVSHNDKRKDGYRRVKCNGTNLPAQSAKSAVADIEAALTENGIEWSKVEFIPPTRGQWFGGIAVTFKD